MANYPTSLDSFTNPTAVDSLSAPSHSLQHADANDAIEALEAKLGIGNSPAGSATAGRVLVAGTGGTTTWTTVSAGAISTTGGTAGQYLSAGTAGVATWATIPEPGLTQIVPTSITKGASGSASVSAGGVVTFTGTESIAIDGAFTSTYSNYKLILTTSDISTNTATISYAYRSSVPADITTNYATVTMFGYNTSTVVTRVYTGVLSRPISTAAADYEYGLYTFDLSNPLNTTAKMMTGTFSQLTSDYTGEYIAGVISTRNMSATAASGIKFSMSSGTFTGTVSIYGYKAG